MRLEGTVKGILDPLENYMDYEWPYDVKKTIRSRQDFIHMFGGGGGSALFWLVYLIVLIITAGVALLALPIILIHFNHQKREVKVWARGVEPGIVEITVKGSDDWERAALTYLRQNFREAGDASLVLGEDLSPTSAAGYCSKCGTQVSEGDVFCSSCGTRLQTP